MPLVLVSLVQLSIGLVLVARADKQVATLQADLTREPAPARAKELARMDRINVNFKMVKILEAVLIVGALAMTFAFRGRPTVTAVGLGILASGSDAGFRYLRRASRTHVHRLAAPLRPGARVPQYSSIGVTNDVQLRPIHQGAKEMFKTALQEEPTGVPWGVIAAFAAFFVLLGTGYFLVT